MRHRDLVTAVTDLFHREKGRAGRDQLTKMVNNAGVQVSAPTVGSIMAEAGLRAARTRAWKKTTVQDPQAADESPRVMGAHRPRVDPAGYHPTTSDTIFR